MKSRLVGLTLATLLGAFGAGAALAHEPLEAASTHWLEHADQPMPGATGPTRAATARVSTPVPHATSSTRSPERSFAASATRSVHS